MKILFYSFYGSIIFMLALAGCSPQTASKATNAAGLKTIDISSLKAGTSMKWYDQNELVFVPQGQFVMGGKGDNPLQSERNVALSNYWIYRYPVTNQMYQLCIDSGACTPPAQGPPYPDITDATIKDNPVVGVTWKQASTYCGWMNARLPTEAEWEKAARGENGNVYPWGNDKPSCDKANYKGCRGGTTSVTSFPQGASPYGAYDMAGNVYEWVNDWFQDQPLSSETSDPQGPTTGTQRVIKSSSYKSTEDLLPASSRFSLEPGKYRQDLGFRCAVQNPQGFASFCKISATSGSTNGCKAPKPDISVTPFCENRGTNTGGVNIRISVDPESSPHMIPYVHGSIHCSDSNLPDNPAQTHLVTCTGPENATFNVGFSTFCRAPGNTVTTLNCPRGYSYSSPSGVVNGFCYKAARFAVNEGDCPAGTIYNGGAGGGDCILMNGPTTSCPTGFGYDASNSCCSQSSGGPVSVVRMCAPNYIYDPGMGLCVKADSTSWDFTATLGNCKTVGGGNSGKPGGSICSGGKKLVCKPGSGTTGFDTGSCSCQ